jgi:transposase-like protein
MSNTDFPIHPDNCEFLNARNLILSKPCPHCHRSGFVRPHGYRQKTHASPHASRFFCSNRYSHGGCGHTFSVFWEKSIPFASLDTKSLSKLIECVSEQPDRTIHAIFQQSKDVLHISLSTAYRWIRRFKLHQSTIRCALFRLVQRRPEDCDLPNETITWRWLKESFADLACPVAAFQSQFQLAFAPCAQGRLPSFYRSPYRSQDGVGTATQNDKLNSAWNTGIEPETNDVPPEPDHLRTGAKPFKRRPIQSLAMPEKIPSTRASE